MQVFENWTGSSVPSRPLTSCQMRKELQCFSNEEEKPKAPQMQDERAFDGQCSDSSSEDSADEDQPDHSVLEAAESASAGEMGRCCMTPTSCLGLQSISGIPCRGLSICSKMKPFEVRVWQRHHQDLPCFAVSSSDSPADLQTMFQQIQKESVMSRP